MGGVTLHDVFDFLIPSLSVNELIKLGNLTPFKYFAPDIGVDVSNVKIQHGDFANRDLEKVMIDKKIIGGIVDNYKIYADGKSAICYCVNVNHSKDVADAFNRAGIKAAHVDADTPKKIRELLVADFRNGKIKILCNAELFSEGFDVPGCQAVILARPTQSLTLYIQQAMRPLRPDPNNPFKTAIIIDHVQNYLRHGLPNKIHHWSLDPNDKKKIQCPHCQQMITTIIKSVTLPKVISGKEVSVTEKRKFCPKCNYMFDKGAAPEISSRHAEHIAGSLDEISVNFDVTDNSQKIIHKPTSIEELIIVADRKKYSRAWAALKALDYVKSFDDCLHIADVCGYKKGWAWHKWQDIQSEISFGNLLKNVPPSC